MGKVDKNINSRPVDGTGWATGCRIKLLSKKNGGQNGNNGRILMELNYQLPTSVQVASLRPTSKRVMNGYDYYLKLVAADVSRMTWDWVKHFKQSALLQAG